VEKVVLSLFLIAVLDGSPTFARTARTAVALARPEVTVVRFDI